MSELKHRPPKEKTKSSAGPKSPTLPENQTREGWGTQCVTI
jgi:hypothetical protein